MKPPYDSRMADEKAAIDLQRKQPSWRATKAVNRVPPTWRRPGMDLLSLGVITALIALIFLIGWLVRVR